jgi:hypothetical protein
LDTFGTDRKSRRSGHAHRKLKQRVPQLKKSAGWDALLEKRKYEAISVADRASGGNANSNVTQEWKKKIARQNRVTQNVGQIRRFFGRQ